MLNSGKNWRFFVPGDFENWRMTLKNNKAPLLYYVKLCASFQIHSWSQTWVTAWKHLSRVKIGDFLSRMTLKIDVWPWKTIGHLSYAASTFVHHFIANGAFKLELQSGNAQFGSKSTIFLAVWPWYLTDNFEEQWGTSSEQHQALSIISSPYVNSNWSYGPETAKWGHDLCDLDLWPLTLNFYMEIMSVNGNNSWKFQDDMMTGTLSKRCDRRTAGQTDRQTDRRTDGQTYGQTDRQTDRRK